MRTWVGLFVGIVTAFGIDLVSKAAAERALVLFQPIELAGDWLRLTLGYNTGVAFGMFANGGIWPLVGTGVIIAALVIWLSAALRAGQLPPAAAIPVGLMLGGAIGNFADRLPDGRVTDFIDVGIGAARWPTFNLADSFIVLGIALLLMRTMLPRQSSPEAA